MYFSYITVYPEVIASAALFAHCTRSEALSFFLFQHALFLDLFFRLWCLPFYDCHMDVCSRQADGGEHHQYHLQSEFIPFIRKGKTSSGMTRERSLYDFTGQNWVVLVAGKSGKVSVHFCSVCGRRPWGHHCKRLLSLPVTSASLP